MFKDKRILVTGGTGSFGRHIVRRLLAYGPREIRIFSRDEKKQWDMRREFNQACNVTFQIGDVRDYWSTRTAMRDIEIVFHGAALKQVPNCEYNVLEAVRTNTLGAVNIIETAIDERVERVIALSTDKAVKPVNVMGMTKALGERLVLNASLRQGSNQTRFACVRYGNVVCSRGSVVPLFRGQIAQGGPVTITVPEMTRFLLTLSEAIDLVFRAATEAVGGEIFVRKAPSVRIGELAQVMIEELRNGDSIEVKTVGIRPGEKLHEILVSEEESWRTVETEWGFIILPALPVPSIKEKYGDFRNANCFEYSSGTNSLLNRDKLRRLLEQERWCGLEPM